MIKAGSLRLRLIVAWLIFLALTLPLVGFGIEELFERSVERTAVSDLMSDLDALSDAFTIDDFGNARLSAVPANQNYLKAYGHRYWQILEGKTPVMRSASLWGDVLKSVENVKPGKDLTIHRMDGPDDQSLLAVSRIVKIAGATDRIFEIIAAIDYSEIFDARKRFEADLFIGLAGIFVAFFATAASLLMLALRPLQRVESALLAVRNGQSDKIEGNFPQEIMPLVSETNALISARDHDLTVAQERAGNLAHGLKTPLAIMAAQSRQIRRGAPVSADDVDAQILAMQRHIERELAVARPRALAGMHRERLQALAEIGDIVNALQKLPRSDTLSWDLSVNASLTVSIDRIDFNAIIGNILENAQKWASHQIQIDGRQNGNLILFTIDDDGPGVKDDQIQRIRRRGERADLSVPGSGLGLSIAGDLIEIYGGQLAFARSPLGGLRAEITLHEQGSA